MMTKVKTNFFYLLVAICTVGFITSCSSDDPMDTCTLTCDADQVLSSNCECVDLTSSTEVLVTSNISENTTWTSDKEWILSTRVSVLDGATLTIEPGTVVKGAAGSGANSTVLIVARGGMINACGTADAPIILTSSADNITSAMVASGNFVSPNLTADIQGLWGGLIVLGKAPISAAEDDGTQLSEVQIEGIPTSDANGLYGGNDSADNSGSICYVSVRHGGTNIGDGNEINGITLGGVGSGTTIDNVEIVANADDGIEWFGGSVSVTNALVWSCGDDGMDTDQAWNGTCDNWIVAVPTGGSCMELDGPEGDFEQGCNSFINGTIYTGGNIDHIIDWDGSTNTGIEDVYINVAGIVTDPSDEDYYNPESGIESFGGDGNCTTRSWVYTVPSGYDGDTMFDDVIAAGEATEVSANGNAVGATNVFDWTLGGQSGTLSSIGL